MANPYLSGPSTQFKISKSSQATIVFSYSNELPYLRLRMGKYLSFLSSFNITIGFMRFGVHGNHVI